ncbi:MAG: hypothetical protein WC666_03280 [Candidatus Paceibacterota bacterium]|jgi:hypothetical protein
MITEKVAGRSVEEFRMAAIQNVVSRINAMTIVNTVAEDYYPILHTSLTVHNGISLSGKFKTSTTDTGAISYVTVLRQVDSIAPADGLGFAWTIGDGSKYNVYLVDSNPLNDDLMLNENFLLQNAGENTFLSAGKGTINTNIQYSFRMDVGLNYSIDLWIWPTSEGALNVNGVNTIKLTHSGFTPRSDGEHFGIGVLGTKGAEWYYDDLLIESSASLHTSALFKLKADSSLFPNGSSATVKFYGYGYDGTTYGLKAFMYKPLTVAWEEIGSNTSTNVTPSANTLISKTFTMGTTYRDGSDFIYFMVTTPDTGLAPSEVTTYYVSLENTSPDGIHIGGKSDIYIEDPINIVTAEQVVDNIDGRINLSSANGFASPILNVARVTVESTGDELTEFSDWALYSDNTGLAYSTREVPYLSVDPAYNLLQLRVAYRFNQKGTSIQSLLDSSEYRFIGTDSLAKIMPPVIIRVNNLEYKGTTTVDQVKELIKLYVLDNKVIVVSEIIALLMSNGATFIDTTTLDIQAYEYDHLRNVTTISSITTSYSIPSFRSGYTDAYDLTGVVKL